MCPDWYDMELSVLMIIIIIIIIESLFYIIFSKLIN